MQLTDTHSHIFLPEFDTDRDLVIQRAIQGGVNRFFLPHVDSSSTAAQTELINKYPAFCFPLMGLHPTSVEEDYLSELKHIEKNLQNAQYYGIGEIGTDLYWDTSFKTEQIEVFVTQLSWANQLKLPVVIHVRNSFAETIAAIDQSGLTGLTGIFHCFTGTLEEAQEVIKRGFLLGIGGVLTFKNSNLDKVIAEIDPKHIVLETDSPYLAPVPKRGKRNEPAYLQYIAKTLADIYSINVDELAMITTRNSKHLFKI